MTKEDWLQHLEGLHPKGQAGIELGLERIRLVKGISSTETSIHLETLRTTTSASAPPGATQKDS